MRTIIRTVDSRNHTLSVSDIDGELQERLEEYAERLERMGKGTYTLADLVKKIVCDTIGNIEKL